LQTQNRHMMNRKVYLLLVALLGFLHIANAQTGFGEIRGKLIDEKSRKPLDFASVQVKLNGEVRGAAYTDEDGNFVLKTLTPGKYVVEASTLGYQKVEMTNVVVNADKITFINISLTPIEGGVQLPEVKKIERKTPIIDPKGTSGESFDAEDIIKMPTRNVNNIANTVAGVTSVNGGTPTFRGARADGTAYYIDGVRVNFGSTGVPQNMINQIQIITAGVPAQYGDFTGGAISVTTKGPSRYYTGGVELITSTPFDKYHYNQLEAFLSGPIWKTKHEDENQRKSILGFSFGGNVNYVQDPRPMSGGVWKTKDGVLNNLEQNPLRLASGGTGFVNNAEFITKNDLEKVDARLNSPTHGFNLTGSLVYQPKSNIIVTLGGQTNYSNSKNQVTNSNSFNNVNNFSSSLFNYDEYPQRVANTYRIYLKFTQKFDNANQDKEKAKKSNIQNAYYTVRIDYTRSSLVQQDPKFKEDFFRYGHIGKFTTYSREVFDTYNAGVNGSPKKFIDQNGDTISLTYFEEMLGFADTLYSFQRAEDNPVAANYTTNLYNLSTAQGTTIRNINYVRQNLGLVNGDNPQSIYSQMWTNPGTQLTGFSKSQVEQYTVFAMGEATVSSKNNPNRKHDLQFGLQHEQQVSRSYGLGATGLWSLARQLMNNQFESGLANQADENGYYRGYLSYDANGVFQDTVRYDRANNAADQKNFDKNFRAMLMARGERDVYGNPINEQSFIDVNSYKPSDFKLTMFSADELLNNGNSYVNYNGYDPYGNIVKGKPSYDRFLNGERVIPAYMPIYQAAWLQDQFIFRDLNIRVGVRVERFDNNMPVLKDPFTLYPTYTAGEVNQLGSAPVTHPGNIGSNYAVYVDDVNNPSKIVGYRNGVDWYNAEGNRVNDPTILANASAGRIQPYLVDPNNQVITTTGTFKDYEPQVNVLPRIYFAFPIAEKSNLFATYDVLTQRPTEGTTAQVDDYYYMQNRTQSTIGNPDLKPTRRTDYELGFKQQIGDYSGLSLIASYSEMRNLITQYRYNQAYPISYTTFSNLDFSTVKSFRVEYELRDKGNISLMANYTLQFADGTGSNSGSSGALLAVGLPNLRTLFPLEYDVRHVVKGTFDYHYKNGDQYNGPIIFGKRVFENAGIALIFNAQSGRPYTVNAQPTPDAQPGVAVRSPIKGNPNGSRLPWQFFTDLNIDKSWMFKMGEYKNKAPRFGSIIAFMQITNLFDARNILGVYRYTGSAQDDGYLNSPVGQVAIDQATNAQSFIDLYNIRIANPGNYALPRWTRLGVRFNF
jgi:hypothetical protein